MRTTLLFLSLLLLFSPALQAQSEADKTKAKEMSEQAVKLADEGKYAEALSLLEKAHRLDAKSSTITYEMAYVHVAQKEYKKAIKLLEAVLPNTDVTDRYYQLLGNTYDYMEQPEQAREVYLTGLRRFQNSGPLHYELGVISYSRWRNRDKAMEYWETGITRAPDYASNYYSAALVLADEERYVWAAVYGELFMNLERNSNRMRKMSKILYKIYTEGISWESDSSCSFDIGKKIDAETETSESNISFFEARFFEAAQGGLCSPVTAEEKAPEGLDWRDPGLREAAFLRTRMVQKWFAKSQPISCSLMGYLQEIAKKGHAEAYNYWLLSEGGATEFEDWVRTHEGKYQEFADWFNPNPMPLDESSVFSRPALEALPSADRD